MKLETEDKILATNFLKQEMEREELEKLYTLILKILELINIDIINPKFSKVNLEIEDDEDCIYKQIKINLEEKCINIGLCKQLKNKYFIATNITYYNENNIEITKILVKNSYPKDDKFMELALKKYKYSIENNIIKDYKEIENINYTKEIPIYSINEYKEKKEHYVKCLSKNKKSHNSVEL